MKAPRTATIANPGSSETHAVKLVKRKRLTNPTYHFAAEFAEVGG
jgi:hypothetical protein